MCKDKSVFQDMMIGARSIFQQEASLFQKDLADVIDRSYAYLLLFPDIWVETPRPISQEELAAEAGHLKEMRLLYWNTFFDMNQSDEECWETLNPIIELYTRIGSGTCLVLPTYAAISAELINVVSRNLARPGVHGGVARMTRLLLAINTLSYAGAGVEHLLVTEAHEAVQGENLRTMAATLLQKTEASSAEIIDLVEKVVLLTEEANVKASFGRKSSGKALVQEVRQSGVRASSIARQLSETLERTVSEAISFVDRRRYPRFNVFIHGTLSVAGCSMSESVIVNNLSIGGVMVHVDPPSLHWRLGSDCVVASSDLGGMHHKGRVVAVRNGNVQVAFANDSRLTIEQLEGAVYTGGLALVDKMKTSHERFVAFVHSAVTDKTKKVTATSLNHHACELGRWYDAIGDEEVHRSKAYKALREPHVKAHTCAQRAISLFHQDNIAGMNEALRDMDSASLEVSACLSALRVKIEYLYEQRRQRKSDS